MASAQKISELTTAGPLTGAELVPIVQNGGTLQTTVSVLSAFAIVSLAPVVSALATQIANISAAIGTDTSVINALANDVAALDIRVTQVSALTSANAAAITSTNNAVSALGVRVEAVSVANAANAAAITSVNAVVSTKVNRVGDFMDSVQYIEFDTSTVVATSAGRLSWSIDEGTLDIGFANQGVVLHTGLQLYQRVYNDTASTLTKGTVIRVTGSQGQRLTAAPALANNDANSATTFAVMAENVSVGNSGFAVTEGVLKNINTAGFADGATLWLSPTSAGQYTTTKPVAPQHLVLVGFVVKGNSVGGGSIYVKIVNGLELGELHDVKVSSSTSLANGEVLVYDTSAGVWTNSTALINAQASISALDVRLAAVSASVSALQVQLNAVSAALTSTNNVVSALEIRVSSASATGVTNSAAITSINNIVSALEIRVSTVSARASALDTRLTAVSASVSALQIQLNAVSAALTSTNNVVSALEIRVSAASATGVANAAAITSTNNVVSALEIRVSTASATGVTNSAAITSINNVVSALEIRVSTVSARASALDTRLTAVSASVSNLQVQITAVSAYVSSLADGLIIEINTLADRVLQVEASVSAINTRLPSGTVVGTTDTQTLTNKRINPRVFTTTTGVSVTPDIGQFEIYAYTALASDLAINAATSGTPVNGNRLMFRFKDNGVARNLTWASVGAGSYRPVGVTLPTVTSAGKVTYVGCLYNEAESFWDVLAVTTQA